MEIKMKKELFEDLEYLISFPADYRKGSKYPVVLFLHGAGTRGNDISVLERNAFMAVGGRYPELSFITVAPHCKTGTWFDRFETLKRFVLMLTCSDYADPERIYLVGNSMGGYGTWQLGMSMPECFAAIIPICGGGMYWNAHTLVYVPVWAFHGDRDSVVSCEESKKMVDAINGMGGNARLTVYPNTDHDSWTATYNNREVFEWLLSQRNQNAKALVDSYSSNQDFG